LPKLVAKLAIRLKTFLRIAMPVKKWHVGVSCIVPTCPLYAVDDPDEFHQKLMEDR
jgi:hypothetical protein